jgi:Ser/Thr protein kinase RdoA (MazF antagonist)
MKPDLRSLAREFQIQGEFQAATPFGNGHINDTYRVTFSHQGQSTRYTFQRINHHIFNDPAALMDNIARVTTHLGQKFAAHPDRHRRALALVPTQGGQKFFVDPSGNHWRVYPFIEGARTFDAVESPRQAFEAARTIGLFQKLLADLPAPRLHDTIPDFHHTPKRFTALEKAVAADAVDRVKVAGPEIEFAFKNKAIAGVLLDAQLPERITHNDTKLNNVLLDEATGEGICIVDLDTVMPGVALYDFGDLVRTTTSPATEDERDLSKVTMQFSMFDALARGYLASADGFLTPAEKRLLASSSKLITFEVGIRFLTDFLNGDTYFKVHRENHNLDRCRTQFKLVESIADQEPAMERLIQTL